MFKSTKDLVVVVLFFAAALLVALGLFAGPSYSSTLWQTLDATPHSYLPLVLYEPTPTYTPTPTSAPVVIKITYVYLPPLLPKANEYAEIANQGTAAQVMTNWKLRNETSGEVFTFPVFTLNPGATVKVYSRTGNNTADKLYWGHRDHQFPIWDAGETACVYDQIWTQVHCYSIR